MSRARRIIFRLALHLGYANPDAMLAEMPLSVLDEWLEYMRLEPFSEYRNDVRVALPVMQLAKALWQGKRRPNFKLKQFLPNWKPRDPVKPKTGEQLLNRMIAMNKALGGHFVDKRKKPDA